MDLELTTRNMGVVGAGGAGFPTHMKIRNKYNIVIANGAECEPLLCNDKYIMQAESDKIISGLELILKYTNADKGFVAVKKKYPTIISSLERAINQKEKIHIYPLDDCYPIGDEFLLVNEIVGKVVPPGGIPLDVGCLVENVETLKNIFEATKGKPVIKRSLTCTGELNKPAIVLAPIGMPIREIIKICQPKIENFAVIIGGPMMGRIEYNLDEPVTKTMSGLIVLPRDHPLILKRTMKIEYIVKQSKSACCQCTYCTEFCPRYLLGHELYPHKIMRQINLGLNLPLEVIQNALLCSECGLCEVVCPMDLSPRIINQEIKLRLISDDYQINFGEEKITEREYYFSRRIPNSRIKNRLNIDKYDECQKLFRNVVEPDVKQVEILLLQHIGKVAQPIVKKGDYVHEGDLIADIQADSLGARLHASITGKIIFVDSERIIIKRTEI